MQNNLSAVTYADLLGVMDSSQLSVAEIAESLGISHMTYRRWRSKPSSANLPPLYLRAFGDIVSRLVTEGRLSVADATVIRMMKYSTGTYFTAALQRLNLGNDFLDGKKTNESSILDALGQIGSRPEYQANVEKRLNTLSRGLNFGDSIKRSIATLREVIRSPKLGRMEKLVAFGALFYLISPFDLIPDHIPVIGFLDDFAMLSIAAAHYAKLGKKK